MAGEKSKKVATATSKKVVPTKGKATKAVAALKKGSGRKATRVHTKVHFYKPKTLQLARKPKVVSIPKSADTTAAYDVIKFPLNSESARRGFNDNTITFIVALTANKKQIKSAVKKLYDITAAKVNTLIRPDGSKKAYVKLTSDYEAADVASKLGLI